MPDESFFRFCAREPRGECAPKLKLGMRGNGSFSNYCTHHGLSVAISARLCVSLTLSFQ